MEAKGAGEELYTWHGKGAGPHLWAGGWERDRDRETAEKQRHAEAEIKLDCEQEREGSGREKTSSRPLEIFSPQN